MTDVVDSVTRSRFMSGIRGKNTRPERMIQEALEYKGYEFRLHDSTLPGKPDFVLPEFNAVIFTHGCFWHRHDCHMFKWPSTRPDFWKKKINRNREVDIRNYKQLKNNGWYILTVWECALKGKMRKPFGNVVRSTEHWLLYEYRNKTIRGYERR